MLKSTYVVGVRPWRFRPKRLKQQSGHDLIDIEFGIIAAENAIKGCEMVGRHDFASQIRSVTEEFRRQAPWLRELRNAVEHFDDYLRGIGNASDAKSGFI